jgi:hypothetical protein
LFFGKSINRVSLELGSASWGIVFPEMLFSKDILENSRVLVEQSSIEGTGLSPGRNQEKVTFKVHFSFIQTGLKHSFQRLEYSTWI